MRLNKFLSTAGVCSRRKADEYIKRGFVKVNSKIVKELGITINPEKDIVEFRDRIIKAQKLVYAILNKPCCYLTQLGEHPEKPTIAQLIKNINQRVYPAGRLDYNVEGLIILTNDGDLAKKIMHPKHELQKVYLAVVKGLIDEELLKKMQKGVMLEDGFAKPDNIKLIKALSNKTQIEIAFHEGRKHLVKRFFLAFNRPIQHLKRIAIGPIALGDLERGKWRYLRQNEIKALLKAINNGG